MTEIFRTLHIIQKKETGDITITNRINRTYVLKTELSCLLYSPVLCCAVLYWAKFYWEVLPHLYGLSRSQVHRQKSQQDLQTDGHLLLPMPLAASVPRVEEQIMHSSISVLNKNKDYSRRTVQRIWWCMWNFCSRQELVPVPLYVLPCPYGLLSSSLRRPWHLRQEFLLGCRIEGSLEACVGPATRNEVKHSYVYTVKDRNGS